MRMTNRLLVLLFLFIHFHVNGQQQWSLKEWPVATPQSQSMNADSLQAFDNAITSGQYGNVDGMIITRNGKLIYQKTYKHDYDKIYRDSISKDLTKIYYLFLKEGNWNGKQLVTTGLNIIGGSPSLRVTEAIRRLINAVADKK